MTVAGEEIPGMHSRKSDAWISSWKQEERKWMKDGMATYSKGQSLEATDEKDLDLAIAVFREWTHIAKEEERSDRVGTYRGTRASR